MQSDDASLEQACLCTYVDDKVRVCAWSYFSVFAARGEMRWLKQVPRGI